MYHYTKFQSKKHSCRSDPVNVVSYNIAIVYAGGNPYGVELPKLGALKAKIRRFPNDHWTLK